MDDLISRQEAVDAIMSGMVDINDSHFENASECNGFLLWARAEIMKLPSAQPEIIHCKDCDWWTKQKDSLQGRCELMKMYPTGGWFCANGRRRTDG